MATTVSSTACAAQPKVVHSGANSVSVKVTAGKTMTAAEVTTFKLFKLPHGAIIDALLEFHGATSATAPTDFGVTGEISALASAVAIGNNFVGAATGYQVSCSDDAVIQYKFVTASVTPGTSTSTISINATCIYHMPPR